MHSAAVCELVTEATSFCESAVFALAVFETSASVIIVITGDSQYLLVQA